MVIRHFGVQSNITAHLPLSTQLPLPARDSHPYRPNPAANNTEFCSSYSLVTCVCSSFSNINSNNKQCSSSMLMHSNSNTSRYITAPSQQSYFQSNLLLTKRKSGHV